MVGRYLYSRLDFKDMDVLFGVKKGTSSPSEDKSPSKVRNTESIRFSGVVIAVYSAKMLLTRAERFVPLRRARRSIRATTSSERIKL